RRTSAWISALLLTTVAWGTAPVAQEGHRATVEVGDWALYKNKSVLAAVDATVKFVVLAKDAKEATIRREGRLGEKVFDTQEYKAPLSQLAEPNGLHENTVPQGAKLATTTLAAISHRGYCARLSFVA